MHGLFSHLRNTWFKNVGPVGVVFDGVDDSSTGAIYIHTLSSIHGLSLGMDWRMDGLICHCLFYIGFKFYVHESICPPEFCIKTP